MAAQASPRSVMPSSPDMDGDRGMPRISGLDNDVLDSAALVDEVPLVEEDEELEKEEEEDESLGLPGCGDEDY